MQADALKKFKEVQKQSWGLFTPIEVFTTVPAAKLVKFSKVEKGQTVLDVGCGTAVVAVTAARLGAQVSGLDLSPALIERAKENIAIAEVKVNLQEGDVEDLPYPDDAFDVVLSQFGHMFAPRPDVAMKEMLRVLKPGGTIAFSTWPPHLYVGLLFSLVAKFVPPPEGVSPSSLWGDPTFVKQKLGDAVNDLIFTQDVMHFPAMSFGHYLQTIETTLGPLLKLVQESKDNPSKLHQFRTELKKLADEYYHDNFVHQTFLMTRARKQMEK